ncbi:AMP-binding enzyme [Aldersonia kunmingensis]|uniref:AMP-binding enzyme n=1 Tax=Aldersonia kunmingensis TaxID=408066 RepID=UPI00082F2396
MHRRPHATLGYDNLPETTAEAFAGGWFHSDDLGYFDSDGFLWVVDRKKDMMKTGGENVATREVEGVLYELPEIHEVGVYGVPDDRWIEAVATTVVIADGAAIDTHAITTHCRTRLAP